MDGHVRNLSVRNCAFRAPPQHTTNMGFTITGDGQPVEFRNTIISHATGVILAPRRTLLVENCVCGGVNWNSENGQPDPDAVLIRRSTLWNPGPRGGLIFTGKAKSSNLRPGGAKLVGFGLFCVRHRSAEMAGRRVTSTVFVARGSPMAVSARWRPGKRSSAVTPMPRNCPPCCWSPGLWQMLPGQPQTPAGQDYGADVARLAR